MRLEGCGQLASLRATTEFYGAFGRTMAQPIRNSGWRPLTSHSNARGTSGTRPGKPLRDVGGRRA